MTQLKIHALALAFPEVSDDDFEALKADIKANGLREPLILLDGQILDGRTRYQACCELGIQAPSFKYEGSDPVQFVKSANLYRRHLTPSQRAAAVVACSDWMDAHRPAAPVKRVALRPVNKVEVASTLTPEVQDVPFRETPRTNADMGKEAGVSPRTISDAKTAHKAGLSDAIRDGTLTASEAATVARGEPAKPRKAPKAKPEPEPVAQVEPVDAGELSELQEKVDFLADENTSLSDRLAVHFMEGTADEKAAAADLIDELRGQLKVAEAENDALRSARDGQMTKAAELERQVKSMRRALDRFEKDAKAAA